MSRIDSLIAAMTLPEKLGQLTMATADSAITGAVMTLDLDSGIASGEIGNVINLFGADRVHAMQRQALEKTRLRIPLLFGFDVIHGHRTIFPIPLGEAALFDPGLWEGSSRSWPARSTCAAPKRTSWTRPPNWRRLRCSVASSTISYLSGHAMTN